MKKLLFLLTISLVFPVASLAATIDTGWNGRVLIVDEESNEVLVPTGNSFGVNTSDTSGASVFVKGDGNNSNVTPYAIASSTAGTVPYVTKIDDTGSTVFMNSAQTAGIFVSGNSTYIFDGNGNSLDLGDLKN